MFSKLGALAVLSLCLLVGRSVQEKCAPQGVLNLELTVSHLLQWSVRPDEPCDIDEFHIHIFYPDQPAEYLFRTTRPVIDLSFLKTCEEWIFAVVPVSGYIVGAERRLVAKLPTPASADLSVAYINIQHNTDTGYSHLQWALTDRIVGNCSIIYKVSVEEEGDQVAEDFYAISPHLDLKHLAPCKTYDFKINAINNATPTIEGPLKTSKIALPGRRQNAPFLLAANSTPSTISLSFRLESEVRNRCQLGSLMIEGDGPVSQTIPLGTQDRNSPVNVTIDNLLPSTAYHMSVYVHNTGGWSDPTTLTITTKDIEAELPYIEEGQE